MPVAARQHFKNYSSSERETGVLMGAVTIFFSILNLKNELHSELGVLF